ncbi:MAG TPA: tyrosine-type recombinase/integrase [Polyangia bacterium]|nr:tyrosine-type recombinase/integrase [Polyangia bacterium]
MVAVRIQTFPARCSVAFGSISELRSTPPAELAIFAPDKIVAYAVKCSPWQALYLFRTTATEDSAAHLKGVSAPVNLLYVANTGRTVDKTLSALRGLRQRWEDVNPRSKVLTVSRTDWRGEVGTPKGADIRHVPMTSRLAEALRSIRHLRGELVFCRQDGSRLTTTNMRAVLKRQEKRAGLPAGAKWHKLRHTFCSHLAMRGAPIVSIKELAGHKSVAVTNRYMHLAPGRTRSAIDLLEARG